MSGNPADLWSEVLRQMEGLLSKHQYETWLRPTMAMAIEGDTLVVGLPSQFAREWIESHYIKQLTDMVRVAAGKSLLLHFEIPAESSVAATAERVPEAPRKAPREDTLSKTLNPKYTFDTFVVGNSNRFAHAASLAVAEMPARAYNPFFVYGGVGLGKTHLMQAIGHHVLRGSPHPKVLYVTSETFTNELINAIRDDKTVEFRNRYRTIDVLLIDDIQFISGKERTQEEFFHTFETLHGASKQIVISSDRPPKEIPTLEERLRSRFEWGLITDIQAPDFETRVAILRKKAQQERLDIPNECMAFIASKIETNIRELEGALIRVVAYCSLHRLTPTPDLTAEILKDVLPASKPHKITVELIQAVVANYYNLRIEDLSAKKRTRAIAFPRQVAMYLTRDMTDMSLPKIGEEFGGRDHSTVMHACDKIEHDLLNDPGLRATIDELVAHIRQG